VELERAPAPTLRITPEIDRAASGRVRKVVRKLLRHAAALRAMPLEPLLQIAPPGRGFHSGGTLPMRAAPQPFESDTLGRPQGWHRLHVVDSSVLPSIPATTITYSVMANAHRIATAAGV
jgi:choline dehydrogenase-like flavoprotein